MAACRACPTMRGWRKFPAAALGRRDARFVLVGEAPGIASIENARQWTGAGGMILRREIRRLGLDLEDLFYLTNAVKCWPARARPGRRRPANRSPLASEAHRCRPFLAAELEALRPEVVVAVGAVAARAVLDRPVRLPDDHGLRIRIDGREVVVLLHPANASRHPGVWRTYRASLLALFGELAARAGFPVVEVVAAVIRRRDRVLVTRRGPGKHLAGLWEFPGGKRHLGESLAEALQRELAEELGVEARVGERLAVVPWTYPDLQLSPVAGIRVSRAPAPAATGRRVVLHFFDCAIGNQPVTPKEGQPARWVSPEELTRLPFPPADAALIKQLVRHPSARSSSGSAPRSGSWRRRAGASEFVRRSPFVTRP